MQVTKQIGARARAGLLAGLGLALPVGALAAPSPAPIPGVARTGAPQAPISSSVAVPAGTRLVFVSGTVPDPVAFPAGGGRPDFGDTRTQVRSILGKIEAALAQQGMTLGDVTMMHVYLVAPTGATGMDFAGMMQSYLEKFGTPAQPNKPSRTTVQVAGLVVAGMLAEIDVVAARGGPEK